MNLQKQFGWSVATEVARYTIQPLVALILARFLNPEDFGVVGMCLVVLSFLQALKDGGFSQVIVQGEKENIADFVFSIQLLLGFLGMGAMIVCAPWIASFYNVRELIEPLRVLAISLIISPFVDIPVLICQRKLDFKATFLRSVIVPSLMGVVAITLAVCGYGYWALVYGMLTSQICAAILLPILSGWRPKIDLSVADRGKDMEFGLHMFYQGLLRWMKNSIAKLTLGKTQGAGQLGLYEVAQQMANMPYSCVAGALQKLAFPAMAQQQRDGVHIGPLFMMMVRRMSLFSIPLGVAAAWGATSLIAVVLGAKWLPMHYIFLACLVVANTAAFVQMNVAALKAVGKPKVLSWFLTFRTILSFPLYIWASVYGIDVLAIAVAGFALLMSPINTYITCRALGISFIQYVMQPVKACLIPVGMISMVGIFLTFVSFGDYVNLLCLVLVTVLSVLLNIWLVERNLFIATVGRIFGGVNRRGAN